MNHCPDLLDINNRCLDGRELKQQILESEHTKEGSKIKILFKPCLFRDNGGRGVSKLITTNIIFSGTQVKLMVLGNPLRSKGYLPIVKRSRKDLIVKGKECPYLKCPKSNREWKQDIGRSKRMLADGPGTRYHGLPRVQQVPLLCVCRNKTMSKST